MKFFDILVAKSFEVTKDGLPEKRTQWNRVGRAWPAKTSEVLHVELFLFPGQRYQIHMKDEPEETPRGPQVPSEDAPF